MATLHSNGREVARYRRTWERTDESGEVTTYTETVSVRRCPRVRGDRAAILKRVDWTCESYGRHAGTWKHYYVSRTTGVAARRMPLAKMERVLTSLRRGVQGFEVVMDRGVARD